MPGKSVWGCALLFMAACAAPAEQVRGPPRAAPGALSAAPARQQAPGAGRSEGKAKVICETERPTGSNIAVRTCRTVERVELERQQAQEALRNRAGSSAPRGAGQ